MFSRPPIRVLAVAVLATGIVLIHGGRASRTNAATTSTRGDVDCSGTTDGADALALERSLSGDLETPSQGCDAVGTATASGVAGDSNCDGAIDATDVIDTLKLAAGVLLTPCFVVSDAGSGAVTKAVGPEGGTLLTTGPDGSTYTLDIPADALVDAQAITMTPLASVTGLPFSGGLVAGVDLQPSGLTFLAPATLTIVPAQVVAPDAETPFTVSGGQLGFAPVLPQTGPLKILVEHFTGYGLASGTDADRSAAASDYMPSDAGNQLLNQAREHLAKAREDELNGDHDGAQAELSQYSSLVAQYFTVEIEPNLQRAASDCGFAKSFLPYALSWARSVQLVTGADTEIAAVTQVMQTFTDALENCFNEAYQRCLAHDLSAIPEMLEYGRVLELIGVDVGAEQKLNDCPAPCQQVDSCHWVGSISAEVYYNYQSATFTITVDNLDFEPDPSTSSGSTVDYVLASAGDATWHIDGPYGSGCIAHGAMQLQPPGSGGEAALQGSIGVDFAQQTYLGSIIGYDESARFMVSCNGGQPYEMLWPVNAVLDMGGDEYPLAGRAGTLAVGSCDVPSTSYGGHWTWNLHAEPR